MIHIRIRKTLDWQDEAVVAAGLIPAMRPKVAVWNATFTMPYHRFRHRLRQITELCLGRVEGAIVSAQGDIPPGVIVVPIDDDDWLAPDLARRLTHAYRPDARGYLWRPYALEPLPLRTGLGWLWAQMVGRAPDPVICKTNNYALASDPDLLPLVRGHLAASRYFEAHLSEVTRIDAILGVQNRNLASQTALGWHRPTVARSELIDSLRRYRRLYGGAVAPEVAWATPYVGLMAELMRDVHVR